MNRPEEFTNFEMAYSIKLDISRSCILRNGIFVFMLFLFFILQGCAFRQYGPQIVDEGIMFSLTAPDAKKVVIAGSFNQWDTESLPLSGPDESGKWSIVIPLHAGRYEYLFLVNGEKWLLDPSAFAEEDGLGGKNSVFTIRN